jgi:RNA polymerase sigma-70 factor (ECF subfamily)
LEGALSRFLRGNCRSASEVEDLRQEIYVRVYESARAARPTFAKAFVFSVARNLLIDRARRNRVVSIDYVGDVEALNVLVEAVEPERCLLARDALIRLQAAVDALPPRCRQVIVLRKINGLSQRDVAAHMGITEDTVERQVMNGVRKLAAAMADG